MKSSLSISGALIRTVVDCFLLPGTAMGTEILWLYSLKWKNHVSTYSAALIWFIFSQMHIDGNDRLVPSHSISEQENTV